MTGRVGQKPSKANWRKAEKGRRSLPMTEVETTQVRVPEDRPTTVAAEEEMTAAVAMAVISEVAMMQRIQQVGSPEIMTRTVEILQEMGSRQRQAQNFKA